MSAFIHILRPKNLVIVGITQYILYHFLILPFVDIPLLEGGLFVLLVIDTIIIAAAGYIINDIYDFTADAYNKPSKTFIPTSISVKTAWRYYLMMVATGMIIALYVAIKIDNLPLFAIYPVAVLLLYFYSSKYKNSILIGNILVSIFVCFVSGIILFAEREAVTTMQNINHKNWVIQLFSVYMVFSFLANMMREIVKDIEDMDGDTQAGIVTYPIRYGRDNACRLVLISAVTTIGLLVTWVVYSYGLLGFRPTMFLLLFIVAPLAIVIQILTKSTAKRDFTRISSLLKWIMIAGIVSIVLISTSTSI